MRVLVIFLPKKTTDMNIIARPHGCDSCYCRPDTTWERENKDFYVPDDINGLSWAPIVFVRISKAGKCIGKKFASRYYDSFNFGALLYCIKDASDIAFTSCTDHTSILPAPLYNPVVMGQEDNVFKVFIGEEEVFKFDTVTVQEQIEDTLCKASALTSLRIGDFVAVELAPVSVLTIRHDGETSFRSSFCDNPLFDMKIIF